MGKDILQLTRRWLFIGVWIFSALVGFLKAFPTLGATAEQQTIKKNSKKSTELKKQKNSVKQNAANLKMKTDKAKKTLGDKKGSSGPIKSSTVSKGKPVSGKVNALVTTPANPTPVSGKTTGEKDPDRKKSLKSQVTSTETKKTASPKKKKIEKETKSPLQKEREPLVEPESDELENSQPNVLVWLIPLGFFAMAGGMIVFQKYQHLLLKGKPAPQDQKVIRPESRAEVALGSVLSSLDLDSTRPDEQLNPPEVNPSRQKSRFKESQESQKPTAAPHAEDDQHRTRVSGNKAKPLDLSSYPVPPKEDQPRSKQEMKPMAIDATLEPGRVDLNLSEVNPIKSNLSSHNAGSVFLEAPPSAVNWVENQSPSDEMPSDESLPKIQHAAGFPTVSLKNSDPKRKS